MRSNVIPNAYVSSERVLIVDVDGTLALRGERDPYDLTTCDADRPNVPVIEAVKSFWHTRTWDYVVVSGRQEIAREATAGWLKRHGLWYASGLLMRRNRDGRPDEVVKRELFETHIKPLWGEFLVLDDRDKVVKMWREELNLPCFQVAYGDH